MSYSQYDADYENSASKRVYNFRAKIDRSVGLDPRALNDGSLGRYLMQTGGDKQFWAFEHEHDRDRFVKRYARAGAEKIEDQPLLQAAPTGSDLNVLDPDCNLLGSDVIAHDAGLDRFFWDRQ